METATISQATGSPADLADLFDSVYQEAKGDVESIPWAEGAANPALVSWLNVVAHQLVRCGGRVAVVGCGLGQDARELIRRGFDVTAFDISPTAVEWAQSLDPTNAECYQVADLFKLPPRWRHRYDLVVEIYTLQSLPPAMRHDAMKAIAEMLSPHGHMLVIARGTEESVTGTKTDPPWPLTRTELVDAAKATGLVVHGEIDEFMDDEDPPVLRLRAVFAHQA